MPQPTFTIGLTMKDNVPLILTKFTTIIINTIIAMPFASNNLFHVKVVNMHDMGSLGRMLQIDLPRDWANLALDRDVWRGVVSWC